MVSLWAVRSLCTRLLCQPDELVVPVLQLGSVQPPSRFTTTMSASVAPQGCCQPLRCSQSTAYPVLILCDGDTASWCLSHPHSSWCLSCSCGFHVGQHDEVVINVDSRYRLPNHILFIYMLCYHQHDLVQYPYLLVLLILQGC